MIKQIIEYFETFEIDNTEQNKIKKQQTSSLLREKNVSLTPFCHYSQTYNTNSEL